MHKILTQFQRSGLNPAVLTNWEELRLKPVTLANHLVWSALGKMLPSDEEIIPLSYKLRPIIENNLRFNFSGIDNPSAVQSRSIELISVEDLEELARSCALSVDIDCEQLRYLMARELEQSIMGGANFIETLKSVSNDLQHNHGIRPMLLIDDLVQSLNIYATDLLDYFITMEEGNWDIVLGVTPASFESTTRGRELLDRIRNQDTFDDRLIKLWTSDEQGHESFVVREVNCDLFAERYLLEYKRRNGFDCGSACAHFNDCSSIWSTTVSSSSLIPFNQPLLKRAFRALPSGKGKPRYFTMAIGEMLYKITQGDLLSALKDNLLRELAADHYDPLTRTVAEAYAPEDAKITGLVSLNSSMLASLGNPLCFDSDNINIRVSSLASLKINHVVEEGDQQLEVDPSKAAIRDWLDGCDVNKELLKGFRLGVAHFIRELSRPCDLLPGHTSRQVAILKWDETNEGSKIPIVIEGVDEFGGLEVSRSIGHQAYYLNYLHLQRGRAKETNTINLVNSGEAFKLILAGQSLKRSLVERLNFDIGITIDELSYILFLLLLELGQAGSEVPGALWVKYQGLQEYPDRIKSLHVRLSEEDVEAARVLFKDWFLLRENVYDGLRLHECYLKYKDADIFGIIMAINTNAVSRQFKIGNMPFSRYLGEVKAKLTILEKNLETEAFHQVASDLESVIQFLEEVQHPSVHSDISYLLSVTAQSVNRQVVMSDWQTCNKLLAKLKKSLRNFLTKDGYVKRANFLGKHRFLMQLGNVEKDPLYQQISGVLKFLDEANHILAEQHFEVNKRLQSAGLLGYRISPDQNYGDGDRTHYYLQLRELAGKVQTLSATKQWLNVVEAAAPYMDSELATATKTILEVLSQLTGLRLPDWFFDRSRAIVESCDKYYEAYETLREVIIDETSAKKAVMQLIFAFGELGNGQLTQLLHGLMQDLIRYRRNLISVLYSFGVTLSPTYSEVVGTNTDYEFSTDAVEATRDLVKFVLQEFTDLPTIENLITTAKGQGINSHSKVLEVLLMDYPPELDLTQEVVSNLADLLDFKQLTDIVKLRVYIKG